MTTHFNTIASIFLLWIRRIGMKPLRCRFCFPHTRFSLPV